MPDYLDHCLWMATFDPSYARKAAKWYSATLERPDILEDFDHADRHPQAQDLRPLRPRVHAGQADASSVRTAVRGWESQV